jgi:predicted CoA-substrate-specific enzyme activase
MPAVAGVDIGAVATKVVILADGRMLASQLLPSGYDGNGAARRGLKRALVEAQLRRGDLAYIVSTGYGRRVFSEANKTITEITAHAEGVRYHFKEARTVVDIGGQDSKAISLGEDGQVANFQMNDKCAAGTGRFLEVMARVLHVNIANMGELALRSTNPARINSMCTVFSESEVISLLTNGRSREDVAMGLCESIARRITAMLKCVGIRERIVFTGGVAKNTGMVSALQKELRSTLLIPPEPQLVGAFGAALLAQKALADGQAAIPPDRARPQTTVEGSQEVACPVAPAPAWQPVWFPKNSA